MLYDATDRLHEARAFYDAELDRNIEEISRLSGVSREHFIKINPADFAEKNKHQVIRGYRYQNVRDFIVANKTDDTFLISPLDAVEETAA